MNEENDLRDAVLKLTQPQRSKVLQTKDLTILNAEGELEATHSVTCIGHVEHAPLLLQLRDAIAAATSRGGGVTQGRERIPLNPAAYKLFDEIAKQINAWYLKLPNPVEERHIHDRLNDWYRHHENQRRAGHVSDEADRLATRLVEQWARQIEGMFDPPEVIEITRPCPECGARFAFDPDSGDQITALVVEYHRLGEQTMENTIARCRSCETVWEGGHGARALSWAIDQAETAGEAA